MLYFQKGPRTWRESTVAFEGLVRGAIPNLGLGGMAAPLAAFHLPEFKVSTEI
jgi:hypothetical protein